MAPPLPLNSISVPHFFSLDLNLPRLALQVAEVMSLLGNAAVTSGYFFMADKVAGYMMVPYKAWLGYANCIYEYLTGFLF